MRHAALQAKASYLRPLTTLPGIGTDGAVANSPSTRQIKSGPCRQHHSGRVCCPRVAGVATMVTTRPVVVLVVGAMCAGAPLADGFTPPSCLGESAIFQRAAESTCISTTYNWVCVPRGGRVRVAPICRYGFDRFGSVSSLFLAHARDPFRTDSNVTPIKNKNVDTQTTHI